MNNTGKTIITYNSKETQTLGEKLAADLKAGDVVCLYGDLGAGKTTFVQGLAKGLGVKKRINSPTFIIVRSYRITNSQSRITTFYHIDLYRTQSLEDLKSVGIEEILQEKDAVVVLEWPEKLGKILPEKRIDVKFEYIDENKRELVIKNYE
ncbi:MAG TPA: tRNA (adenosine(37)-N6)-threonylcarbamoyltransferase complex ATPase subunit type 1 TsaE [Candidatus Saccharimonadales bacterium]|nr:tRNA (adenosine(37)-N6)-threonylcarbamoyltransferase complex ATPase subunit type 1 TsaE [Candidatus Saccharimonadales bacterium]